VQLNLTVQATLQEGGLGNNRYLRAYSLLTTIKKAKVLNMKKRFKFFYILVV